MGGMFETGGRLLLVALQTLNIVFNRETGTRCKRAPEGLVFMMILKSLFFGSVVQQLRLLVAGFF